MPESTAPVWHISGAGNMGSLAAHYLLRAGERVAILTRTPRHRHERTLFYADGRAAQHLSCPAVARSDIDRPIDRLLIACKTSYSAAAIDRLPLAEDVTVIRLQNGIGSLDGLLPANARLIEAVTTSAAHRVPGGHRVVAENRTCMGDGRPAPAWFDGLARHWPQLVWDTGIRFRQWSKLVANAAINPLTALHDVSNGRLIADTKLYDDMRKLVVEADTLLMALDADWPGHSLSTVADIARATAANTSSMRADIHDGAATEIDAINGWLLRQARTLGMDLPINRAIIDRVKALSSQALPR